MFRHEFLNQYLGGSTIFMKAKRSLTSSFDQLMKRRSSKDDVGIMSIKENSLPNNIAFYKVIISIILIYQIIINHIHILLFDL